MLEIKEIYIFKLWNKGIGGKVPNKRGRQEWKDSETEKW